MGAMEEPSDRWQCMPRECLLLVFRRLPLKDRCQVVGGVCTWWRHVALEEELLPDFNLNRVPLFAVRSRYIESFMQQRASFVRWLERRAPCIRNCIMQAERWEDDSMSLMLRVATGQVLGPHLHSLKLVSTGAGQVTSIFLGAGASLRALQIDFWGAGNGLPRQLAACTRLTSLRLQCSSTLDRYSAIGALTNLRELTVFDSGWRRVPQEVCALPRLTSLFLRFADFEASDWLPLAAAGAPAGMACTLASLTLDCCSITALPATLVKLTALSALCLDRNGGLSDMTVLGPPLLRLERLSLEGCRGVVSLGEGAAELPLRSLNLQDSGVAELPPGRYTSTLTTLYWGSTTASSAAPHPPPAGAALPHVLSQQSAGATSAAPQPGAGALLVRAIRDAGALREVYLAGKAGREEVRERAQLLFEALPHLEKVGMPMAGEVIYRSAAGSL